MKRVPGVCDGYTALKQIKGMVDFGDGKGRVPATKHWNIPRGRAGQELRTLMPELGGWVADTAHVDATARITLHAGVTDEGCVFGNGVVRDHGLVSGRGCVQDNAVVSGHGRVTDYGHVSGRGRVRDHASVVEHGRVTDNACLVDYAVVGEQATLEEDAILGGTLSLRGDSTAFIRGKRNGDEMPWVTNGPIRPLPPSDDMDVSEYAH